MPVHIADAKCIAGAWIVKLDHIEVVSQLPVRQKIAGINRASIVVDTQIIEGFQIVGFHTNLDSHFFRLEDAVHGTPDRIAGFIEKKIARFQNLDPSGADQDALDVTEVRSETIF